MFGPVEAEFVDGDFILPPTSLTVSVAGTDVSAFVVSYNVSASRGGGVTGHVVLKDYHSSLLAKAVGTWNTSNNNVYAHNMTASRTITISATQGSVTTQYPTFIFSDPDWDNDGTVTINFSDMTPLIDIDNQDIGDYVRSAGDDKKFSDVLSDINGLVTPSIVSQVSDYDIGTFRGNGINIKSALEDLLSVRQGYLFWSGSTLQLKALPSTPSASRHIIDRRHIPDNGLRFQPDTGSLRTYFRYFKDVPVENVLGEASCTGRMGEESPCVGRVVQVGFNRPARNVRIIAKAFKGSIEDGVFYTEGGAPLGSSPAGQYVAVPPNWTEASYWIGTYVPDFVLGGAMYAPSWSVTAYGGPDPSMMIPTDVEDWEVEETVAEAQAKYGKRPEYKDIESQLIRNQATASEMLLAIELEVLWSINKYNLTTPFLIREREGEFINVTHYRHGLNSKTCLINGWSHSFSYESGWSNSYDLASKL